MNGLRKKYTRAELIEHIHKMLNKSTAEHFHNVCRDGVLSVLDELATKPGLPRALTIEECKQAIDSLQRQMNMLVTEHTLRAIYDAIYFAITDPKPKTKIVWRVMIHTTFKDFDTFEAALQSIAHELRQAGIAITRHEMST